MGSFAQLEGVEGTTETDLNTLGQFLLVSKGDDTGVGDLGLDEGGWVQDVLGGDFDCNRVTGSGGLGVVGGLGTDLQDWGDLVVVTGGEDGQVVGGNEGDGVGWGLVAESSGVVGQDSGLDVVGQGTTGGEAVLAEGQVGVEERALQQVDKGSGGDGVLGEVGVELDGLGGAGNDCGDQFGLEARGDGVGQLQLGGESVVGGPALDDRQACGLVRVLGLQGRRDLVACRLGLRGEGHAVWSRGLHVNGERSCVEEVSRGDVVGRLGDVGERNSWHGVRVRVDWFGGCVWLQRKQTDQLNERTRTATSQRNSRERFKRGCSGAPDGGNGDFKSCRRGFKINTALLEMRCVGNVTVAPGNVPGASARAVHHGRCGDGM